jgi:hypothetical protein
MNKVKTSILIIGLLIAGLAIQSMCQPTEGELLSPLNDPQRVPINLFLPVLLGIMALLAIRFIWRTEKRRKRAREEEKARAKEFNIWLKEHPEYLKRIQN